MIKAIKKFFIHESEDENLLAVSIKDWQMEFRKLLEERTGYTQSEIIKKINDRCALLKDAADSLMKTEFNISNVNERLKEMIEDNRVNYVKQVKMLSDFAIIRKEESNNINDLCHRFFNKISEFSANTNKAYFSLKDAFYSQMSGVAENIKTLNSLYKDLNESAKTGAGKEFEDLKTRMMDYYSDLDLEKTLILEISKSKNEIETSKTRLLEINRRKDEIKQSSWFKQIRDIYEEREKTDSDLKHLNEEIFSTIMHLEDLLNSLKKTSSNSKLIEKYINDPVSALLWDESLEITNILSELKNAISDKTMEVDSKRRQKALGSIERLLKKTFFESWMNEYKKLHKNKRIIEDRIGKTAVMRDLDEVDYQISHLTEKIEKKTHLIHQDEEKIKELDLLRRKGDIESDLSKFAHKRIILT